MRVVECVPISQPDLNMKTLKLTNTVNNTQTTRGFTLVEMLLVLVILATLAAIVYPKVMGRSE